MLVQHGLEMEQCCTRSGDWTHHLNFMQEPYCSVFPLLHTFYIPVMTRTQN